MTRLRKSTERGFTLIEVLAALVVFSLITLGIVPLLASSMKAATLARTGTVAKNAGLKAMEHARDLPYYISYAAQNKRVDILDMYFPVSPVLAPIRHTQARPTTRSPHDASRARRYRDARRICRQGTRSHTSHNS